jgi:hypothetical protein
MWSEDGTVPIDAGHVLPDGEFGDLKWAWYRYVPGKLTITGHRLDAPAPPLRALIPDGYGDTGFQVSGLIFPAGGCWEVTGTGGNAHLTFITLVIPPAGPATPPSWSFGWHSPYSGASAAEPGLTAPAATPAP